MDMYIYMFPIVCCIKFCIVHYREWVIFGVLLCFWISIYIFFFFEALDKNVLVRLDNVFGFWIFFFNF